MGKNVVLMGNRLLKGAFYYYLYIYIPIVFNFSRSTCIFVLLMQMLRYTYIHRIFKWIEKQIL